MGFASSGLRFGFRTKGPGMLRIPSFARVVFFFFCGGGGVGVQTFKAGCAVY